mgnify:CR=1 FL=1
MASNYVKLDLKTFKARITDNHYANATGARRGVGKSEMKAHLELAGIECNDDGCPIMRSPKGRKLLAPLGSERFSRLLAESTGALKKQLEAVGK